MVFADLSGFTAMSERLSRHGRVGAEEVTDAIGACFAELLAVAYDAGGGLLKFGGDALLLAFRGDHHAHRAVWAAAAMRERLRKAGKLKTSAGNVTLRMSVGVHSGTFDCFLVGSPSRELLVIGPAASEVVAMEHGASVGQIVVSPDDCCHIARGLCGRPARRRVPPPARAAAAAGRRPPTPRGRTPHRPAGVHSARRPRARPGWRRLARASRRHGCVRALRRPRRIPRRARPREDCRRARRARDDGCAGMRGPRRRASRNRRRRRWRQVPPHGRCPFGAGARGEADAGDGAAHRRGRSRDLRARRRQPRSGVRGRCRPSLSPHLHRHGRHREPRGSADGRRRAPPRRRNCERPRSRGWFRVVAPATHARQGQARAGRGIRGRRRARPVGRPRRRRRAAVRRARGRARAVGDVPRGRARRRGRVGPYRRPGGHRQVATSGGIAGPLTRDAVDMRHM